MIDALEKLPPKDNLRIFMFMAPIPRAPFAAVSMKAAMIKCLMFMLKS
jgi:hypothetical protein